MTILHDNLDSAVAHGMSSHSVLADDDVKGHNHGLPENTFYQDTGCEVAPQCLECPLALCKYDDPNWKVKPGIAMRDREIMRQHGDGIKVTQIAQSVGTSPRTVYRVIQRDRNLPSSLHHPAAASNHHHRRFRERAPSIPLDRLTEYSQYRLYEPGWER